jgi:hypothetical protein
VPEGIGDLPVAVAPESVGQWPMDGRAGVERTAPRVIDVSHVEIEHRRGAPGSRRRERAVFGELARHHDHRRSEAQLDMDEAIVGQRDSAGLRRAEHRAIPLGCRRVTDDDVRRQHVHGP